MQEAQGLGRLLESPQGAVADIEKPNQAPFEIVKAVKLGADWSHLIECLDTTHIGERMNLLHCVSQDMEALPRCWQAPQGRYQNIKQMCQTTFRAIAKWQPEVGWGRD